MMRRLSISLVSAAANLLVIVTSASGQVTAVEAILAGHAQALGGAELAQVQSLKVTGTYNFNGIDSPYTIYRQRPDRYRFETATARGMVVSAFDGETAWSQGPTRSGEMEVRVMEGDGRQHFLEEDADFDGPLVDCQKKGHKAELVGEVDVDGVAAYHLKLTLAGGNVQQWFIAKDSHQAVRKITTAIHRRYGPYDRVWYLMEHQKTGGVTLPFYIEREDRQHVRAYTVDKVEVGVEIDPEVFKMPAAGGS